MELTHQRNSSTHFVFTCKNANLTDLALFVCICFGSDSYLDSLAPLSYCETLYHTSTSRVLVKGLATPQENDSVMFPWKKVYISWRFQCLIVNGGLNFDSIFLWTGEYSAIVSSQKPGQYFLCSKLKKFFFKLLAIKCKYSLCCSDFNYINNYKYNLSSKKVQFCNFNKTVERSWAAELSSFNSLLGFFFSFDLYY